MAWKGWNSARIAGNTWGQGFRRFRSLNPGKGIAVLAALGGLIWLGAQAAGSVQRAQSAFPVESGRIEVAGLTAPVSMLRDARGIPHVEALTDRDAWLALGLAHAQDRLAQMLWLRRLARGRPGWRQIVSLGRSVSEGLPTGNCRAWPRSREKFSRPTRPE